MKKTNKYISLALFGAIGALLSTSCDDSKDNDSVDYYQGANAGGVYFPSTAPTSVELSEDQTQFSYTIYRGSAKEALTVPVTVTPVEGNTVSSDFTFSPSVTFAAGELTAPLNFTCNVSALEYDVENQFNIVLDPAYASDFGDNEMIVSIVRPAPWVSLGMGIWVDNILGVTPFSNTAEVEVFVSELNSNLFRVSSPYDYADGTEEETPSPYFQFRILQEGETILGQTVSEPDLIYYPDFTIMEDVYYEFPGSYQALNNISNWVYNYVTGYQEDGLPTSVIISPVVDLYGSAYNYSDSEEVMLLFPGVPYINAGIDITYNGLEVSSSGVTQALAYVAIEPDAEYAKIAITYGSLTQEFLNGILDDSVEPATVYKSQDVYLNFEDQGMGTYTIVGVTYYEGEPYEFTYIPFVYAPGSWTEVTTGTYTYLEEMWGGASETLTLYENDYNPNYYRLTHWLYDVNFDFTMDNSGNIIVQAQPTGYYVDGYGMLYVDDVVSYTGETTYGKSYFSNGIYNFDVVYYVPDGAFGYGYETFDTQHFGTRASMGGDLNHNEEAFKSASKKIHMPSAIKRITLPQRANAPKLHRK